MNKELRDRIKQWNEIKYGTDNGDRVVVCAMPRSIKRVESLFL